MGTFKNEHFQSAREFSRRGIKSEKAIRREIANGTVPGFRSGNRFIIDTEAYITQIRAECLSNAEGGART